MNRRLMTAAAALSLGMAGPALAQMGPGPMADPYGDADVTRTEAGAQAAARFDTIDANKDGALAAEELAAQQAPRPAGGPAGGPPPQGRDGRGGGGMMRQADANGDGKITRDEYVAAQLARFDQMDENKDSKATKLERTAFFENLRARMMMGGGN